MTTTTALATWYRAHRDLSLGECPGCTGLMWEDDSREFDARTVSGRWHEDCGEDAKY